MADLFKKLHDKRARLFTQLSDPAAIGVWKMVVDKYSDQAHFLFELLQNADDAGATYVRVQLYSDRLCFIHNGTIPFSITDVDEEDVGTPVGHLNAITSIGASSKTGSNSIGKFGVGFKSVFQYTDVPHIEDDAFCFKIENYIVPEREEPMPSLRKRGETLFSLPFRDPLKAYGEVLGKLKRLKHPLLFLRSLSRIEWNSDSGEKGSYEREFLASSIFSSTEYAFVKETQMLGTDSSSVYYHCFSCDFSLLKNGSLKGSVAYSALADGGLNEQPDSDEVAYCYFPTKEKTNLNFLLHAPFLLTDSREGIKQGEPWNDTMLDQLATLAADALEYFTILKNNNGETILNDNLFNLIPLDSKTYFRKTKESRESISLFSVFYDRFVEKLSVAPLFISSRGYVDCRHTCYTKDKQLMALLDEAKESHLVSELLDVGFNWSFLTLNLENENVFKYLSNHHLCALQITLDKFIETITPLFFQVQTLEWLRRFYMYLAAHSSEWSVEYAQQNLPIYCADGQFLTARDANGKSLLFLSSGTSNAFKVIHPDLLEDSGCRRLFSQLGIAHPDLLSEVECVVLPRYQSHSVVDDDWETIFRDMNLFVDAFLQFRFMDSRQERYLAMFKDVSFIPSSDNQGVCTLRKPSEVYVELEDLKTFLSYDRTAAFLDARLAKEGFLPEKREGFYKFLSAIGLSFGLKFKKVRRVPNLEDCQRFLLAPKSLRQYDDGNQQIEDCEIEGFDSFVAHITEHSSKSFLRLLTAQIERQSSYMLQLSMEGWYRYVERSKKNYTEELIKHTTAWHSLFSTPWLYDAQGVLRTPLEVSSVVNLSSAYDIESADVLFFLGISDDPSLRGLNQEQRKAITLVRSFEQAGVSIQQLEQLLDDFRQGKLSDELISYFGKGA